MSNLRFGPFGKTYFFSMLAVSLVLAQACQQKEQLHPIGEPNPVIERLKASNWVSYDTIISIDMQTGEEQIQSVANDYKPDTLPNGTLVYKLVEHMPVLSPCVEDEDPVLCTQTTLNRIVAENLRYPPRALAQGRQGSGIATFVIGPDGKVGQMGVEQSLGDDLDGAIMQLIENLPAWHPGFMGGKPVSVRYRMPVRFRLPEE